MVEKITFLTCYTVRFNLEIKILLEISGGRVALLLPSYLKDNNIFEQSPTRFFVFDTFW